MSVPDTCLNLGAVAKSDPNLIAGCVQALATIESGRLGASATIDLAHWTFLAGALAIIAAIIGGGIVTWSDRLRKAENVKRVCVTYLSEIAAVSNFLAANDVVGTLRKKAAASERMYFHPGSDWLRIFRQDPSTIGVFPPGLAADVVYYCSRMMNELGRLTWMHTLSDEDITKLTTSGLEREMQNSASTLESLRREETKLQNDIVEFGGLLNELWSRPRTTSSLEFGSFWGRPL